MANRYQEGSVRRKGRTWYGRYRRDNAEGREQLSVVLGYWPEMRTKAQAKTQLQEVLVKEGVNRSDYLERATKPVVTFGAIADQWLEKRLPELSESSKRSIPLRLEKHMRPVFGGLALDQIKSAHVNDWIRSLTAAGLTAKTVHNVFKDFRAICNWHRMEQDQPRMCWYAKLPQVANTPPRWLTPEEIDALVDAATGQYKVYLRLAGYSGMRSCELSGLRYEDIDWTRGTILVRRSATHGVEGRTKSANSTRLVYVDNITLDMLRQHLGDRRTGLVFQNRFGGHVNGVDVNKYVLGPLCKQLGIPKANMHSFRHGYISRLIAKGLPQRFIQNQVGHADPRITRHYTHISDLESLAMVNELAGCGQTTQLWSNVN